MPLAVWMCCFLVLDSFGGGEGSARPSRSRRCCRVSFSACCYANAKSPGGFLIYFAACSAGGMVLIKDCVGLSGPMLA